MKKQNFIIRVLPLLLWGVFCLCSANSVAQQKKSRKNLLRETSPEFFQTEEARRIGDQVLLFQRDTGGWPKNTDMVSKLSEQQQEEILAQKSRIDDSTIDNNATTMQMTYLARLYQATRDERYRDAFIKGVEFLLSGQYENGGWPQFWPNPRGYQVHITFNDDAIVNTLELFNAIKEQKEPYGNELTDKALRKRLEKSFDKGIEIILATQMEVDGELTVWCQQHDRETYEPAPARAYEHPSFCSSESSSILRLLMSLPKPDARVKKAVHAGMKWLDKYKLTGLRYNRFGEKDASGKLNHLIEDANAGPLWARFYDLEYTEPYVCDRDGIKRRRLSQIGTERRMGYSWYNARPAYLYKVYDEWADKHDPKHKLDISKDSKGANETGLIQLYRRPIVDRKDFDVVVRPGESIQKAIEKAPADGKQPFKILVLKGDYEQKVIIDRPNIVLVGEQRDSTVIHLAECGDYRPVKEYKGKEAPRGVVTLTEEASDCVISGLTIYNNYGTTVEPTTAHQFALFGRATRTIVINCNVWADGNDALALWARGGNGFYYHADLDLRCPGVDFLCPRGWCFVTRSTFYGDSRAMIWHDGRGAKDKKLVIKDSYFDAKTPTLLGRYHHDCQFYLLNCHFSENVLDHNIHYAYSDKVLDPCPWGYRVYYHNCMRQGGHSGWLKNNLQEAEGSPVHHAITVRWTFNNQWDPEKQVRDLWNVLAY